VYVSRVSLRARALPAALVLAAACAHAPEAPLSDPPLPAAAVVLRAPERIAMVLGPARIAVKLRNEGNRWARLELDPRLLRVEGRDAAGNPLLCLAPRRPGPRPASELGPSAEQILVFHLQDRCAISLPGSYRLLISYLAPAAGGEGPYTAGPVEVKLEVSPRPKPATGDRSACVDGQLARRGLNSYGDPPGTVYAGGTPLFDESTGRRADRLEHVLARQPEIAAACPPRAGDP
jgi:hypothetical protein